MHQLTNQMEGKTLEHRVTPEMSRKTLKQKVRSTTPVRGRRMSKKNWKKQSKGSAKRSRKSTSYEYEMKSCMTWEFAHVFRDIDNWHESLKGEDSEERLIKIEQQMMKSENVDEIPVDESSVENTNTVDDRQGRRAGAIENEPVGRGPGRFTTSSNGAVITNSTVPGDKVSVSIQNDASPETSVGAAYEHSATFSDDICCEEAFEETENLRRTPRYLRTKSTNNEIIRKPAACDDLGITPEDDMKLPGMLDQQELHNAAANNNNIVGVGIHTNDMQHMKNTVVQSTGPKGLNITKKKQFKCSDCPKDFMRNEHLVVHQRIHSGDKPFKCTECLKMFSKKSTLTIHKRIHTGERPFKCTECLKMFSQKNELTIHKRIHTGERPFKCNDCLKMFSQIGHLITHQRIHSGEKPFKCTECPQMFITKSHVTRHQRIHTGEKPFKCTECPKMFSQNITLKRHQRVHSGEKPFRCTECTKMFSQKSTLKTHQRVHSGVKPFKCTSNNPKETVK